MAPAAVRMVSLVPTPPKTADPTEVDLRKHGSQLGGKALEQCG